MLEDENRVSSEDSPKILLVVTEPKANLDSPRFKNYWTAFSQALRMGRDQLTVISATEETLPTRVSSGGIIFGGSSASAYENLPWIGRLEDFIQRMHKERKPILGVCFGHQIVAQALGGKVEPGLNGIEFGATTVTLTQDGEEDLLYRGLHSPINVAMTHGDVVTTLTPRFDTNVLAANISYPNQSLSFGENTRTVQFHPEMKRAELERIVNANKMALIKQGRVSSSEFDEFIAKLGRTDIETPGRMILSNFVRYFVQPQS